MPRHDYDRFDDDDDIPSTSKGKGGFPGWAIVVLCAVPIFAVVAIGGAIAMFTMRAAQVERAEAGAMQAESRVMVADGPVMQMELQGGKNKGGMKRVFTRDEFKSLIMKTPEGVTAAVGPPEYRIVDGGRTTWRYLNKCKDPATGNIDPVTKVVFEGGVVIDVNY